MCLTYARVQLLEEALQSFLQQDYDGPTELLILNDFADQTLIFDHPQVRVVNLQRRFRTLGEKANAAAALCSHDLICVWDDDDIYLPHRIRQSVERLSPTRGFYSPRRGWMLNHGELSGPESNVFHSGSCFTRELFDSVGGYAAMGNGLDQEIESRFERARPGSTIAAAIDPVDLFYIYRWGGTRSYHISGYGDAAPGEPDEHAQVARHVARAVAAGEIAVGTVTLSPAWRQDYAAMIAAALAAG
jgi:glycosyltransferase involved in cell wall biosynthesis